MFLLNEVHPPRTITNYGLLQQALGSTNLIWLRLADIDSLALVVVSPADMKRVHGTVAKRLLLSAVLLIAPGCQSVAPIHVWLPAKMKSAVGSRVAIAPLGGDRTFAEPLRLAMLTQPPRDPGRIIQCVDTSLLAPANSSVRLVSATSEDSSDLLAMKVAKQQNVDFLLTGEVIEQPSEMRSRLHRHAQYGDELEPLDPVDPTATAIPSPDSDDSTALRPTESKPLEATKKSIAVSWKLVDMRNGGEAKGFPVVTHYDSTLDKPSIAKLAAEDAWSLIAPSVYKDQAKLCVPYLKQGSREVRLGNEAATHGDWMTAQIHWQQALERHPRNHAAIHNLAVAAVAQQNFELANELIGHAIRQSPRSQYRMTAVWIEAKQRDYHDAFGLPDPPSGWSAVRR